MNPYTTLDTTGPVIKGVPTVVKTVDRLKRLAECGPSAIEERLNELEREWSAGRATKVALGLFILIGMGLWLSLGGWWYVVPILGGLVLLEYLFSRTSWLGKLFHEMGSRTGQEIEEEKFALKALRGDFATLSTVHDIEDKDAVDRMVGEGGPAVEFDVEKLDTRAAVEGVLHATRL